MSPPTTSTWAPRPELTVLALVAAAAAATWAGFTDDPPGQLLLGAVALFLAAAGVFGLVVRPRLAADQRGVTVRGLTGRRTWTWGEVNVRLVRTRRLGRETTAIELDADHAEVPDLVVLGRLDLGADPEDVVDALLALRT
ncbi:PH domain-containing protein [Actinophytocola sediminis]